MDHSAKLRPILAAAAELQVALNAHAVLLTRSAVGLPLVDGAANLDNTAVMLTKNVLIN